MANRTAMLRGDQRQCDICDEIIPRGATYRVGYTIPEALKSWFEDAAELIPTFKLEPDGTVRIDMCITCAASGRIGEYTEDAVGGVH